MKFEELALRPSQDASDTRSTGPGVSVKRRWRGVVVVAVVALAAIALAVWRPWSAGTTGSDNAAPQKGRGDMRNAAVPVGAVAATETPFPIRIAGLGTVTAAETVTVRARVDGPLLRVAFAEGERVKAGQVLAEIDPATFQVQVDQAAGQLARDRAQLASANADLVRYHTLLSQDSIAAQQVDQQEWTVKQLQGVVATDEANLANAKLQLSYTRVTAPISGRVGLRQVDPGNLVHATDANGIVVITKVEPIMVVFPVPQDQVPAIARRLAQKAKLAVDAYDRGGRNKLASGALLTMDNLIDATTGTVKLKAQFDNRDGALFPNQFVNARLLLDVESKATVIPSAAVQRGAPGTYVYVVKDDKTVTVRPVKLGPTDADRVAVSDGLRAGEVVVIDGADKLREGARVEVIDRSASAPSGAGDGKSGGRGGRSGRNGAAAGDSAAGKSAAADPQGATKAAP